MKTSTSNKSQFQKATNLNGYLENHSLKIWGFVERFHVKSVKLQNSRISTQTIFLFLLRSLTFREKSFKSVWTEHMMILERISLLSASSREKAFISENAPSASPLHTRLPKYIISIVSFSSYYCSTILQQPWPTFANLGHSLMLDKSKKGNF